MRIPELYTASRPVISLELFPPKTDEAEAALFETVVPSLTRLGPSFLSVTYGAGGGTRTRTLRMAGRLRREFGVEAMAHLTCVGSSRSALAEVLDEAESLGLENVLTLRGDPPRGQPVFEPLPDGFRYAAELIRFVRQRGGFAIGAAVYPEGHVECPNKHLDWDRAIAKVEAGAEFLITQLFYNVEDFFACEEYLRGRGVQVPIIPGVLPFLNAEQIRRFTALCGARLHDDLGRRLDELAHDNEAVRQLGVEVCTELCQRLLAHGVPGLHFYCLNRVPSVAEVLHNLGLADRTVVEVRPVEARNANTPAAY